jgi:DNA repair exonuclease SbcCD nuclease subunit
MGYYGNEFNELEFPKTGKEIEEKALAKAEELKKKLADREKALKVQLEEAGLTDTMDVRLTDTMDILLNIGDLLNEANSSVNVSSDVKVRIQNIVRKVRDEKAELERVGIIVRNIPREETFKLSFDALTYFGF